MKKLLLLVLSITLTSCTIPEEAPEPVEVSQVLNLPKALERAIEYDCTYYGVDRDLVYAYIETVSHNDTSLVTRQDGQVYYGAFQLNASLIGKYRKAGSLDIAESCYSNCSAGIQRLKWALDSNESMQGALMSCYYTQPVARKMWVNGVRSTPLTKTIEKNYKERIEENERK